MKEINCKNKMMTLSKLICCSQQITKNPRFIGNVKLLQSMAESLINILKSKNIMRCINEDDKLNLFQTLNQMLIRQESLCQHFQESDGFKILTDLLTTGYEIPKVETA